MRWGASRSAAPSGLRKAPLLSWGALGGVGPRPGWALGRKAVGSCVGWGHLKGVECGDVVSGGLRRKSRLSTRRSFIEDERLQDHGGDKDLGRWWRLYRVGGSPIGGGRDVQ